MITESALGQWSPVRPLIQGEEVQQARWGDMAPSCSHAVGAGGYASISQLHPPEVAEGLQLFSKHKEWMPFPPLCFPFQQKLKNKTKQKTGGEGPLESGGYGVPTAGAVGRDAEVMSRKAARAVGQLITLSTKVQ